MVTYKPAPPALWLRATRELETVYGLRAVYAWTLASLGEHCVVFYPVRPRDGAELARRLVSHPQVATAQPIQEFATLSAPGDPYAHLQHAALALHLEPAHRWATGKGVTVAVVDTGVDFDHPDLRERVAKAKNFVDRGEQTFTSDLHGTAVSGVIAATADNGIGIIGVAPQAEVWALKACWSRSARDRQAVCNSYTLAKALDFAVLEKAQVLNISLSGPADPLLERIVIAALERGTTVVAAQATASPTGFPAAVPGVIAVRETDFDGVLRAAGGPDVSLLAAPGIDILTTVPRGAFDLYSGSSLAAAHVSGIVALLLERRPGLQPREVAALLQRTARQAGGGSIVDACAALREVVGGEAACPAS